MRHGELPGVILPAARLQQRIVSGFRIPFDTSPSTITLTANTMAKSAFWNSVRKALTVVRYLISSQRHTQRTHLDNASLSIIQQHPLPI